MQHQPAFAARHLNETAQRVRRIDAKQILRHTDRDTDRDTDRGIDGADTGTDTGTNTDTDTVTGTGTDTGTDTDTNTGTLLLMGHTQKKRTDRAEDREKRETERARWTTNADRGINLKIFKQT